jgi:hypothetical protein
MSWDVTGLQGQESKRARPLICFVAVGQGVLDHQPCPLVVQGSSFICAELIAVLPSL